MTTLTLLLRATYWYAEAVEQALHDNGLKELSRRQHFVIANILAGEHRAVRIAKNLGISRQAISQTIMELVNLGYVTARTDPRSKRSRIVEFSPTFEDQVMCAAIFKELDEELGRRIGTKTLRSLRTILELDWGSMPILEKIQRKHGRGQNRRQNSVSLVKAGQARQKPGKRGRLRAVKQA